MRPASADSPLAEATCFEERLEIFRADPAWAQVRTIADRVEARYWSYGAFPAAASELLALPVRMTTYPVGHQREVRKRGLFRANPVTHFARSEGAPTTFGAVRDSAHRTPALLELLDVNRRFGVRHGLLVALPGALGIHAWLGLAYSGNPRDLDEVLATHRDELQQVGNSVQRDVMRRHGRTVAEPFLPLLSPRQRSVAQLLARGCDTEEISDQLRLSIHTVNKHIGAAKRGLRAKSSAELVALCLQWGLID